MLLITVEMEPEHKTALETELFNPDADIRDRQSLESLLADPKLGWPPCASRTALAELLALQSTRLARLEKLAEEGRQGLPLGDLGPRFAGLVGRWGIRP